MSDVEQPLSHPELAAKSVETKSKRDFMPLPGGSGAINDDEETGIDRFRNKFGMIDDAFPLPAGEGGRRLGEGAAKEILKLVQDDSCEVQDDNIQNISLALRDTKGTAEQREACDHVCVVLRVAGDWVWGKAAFTLAEVLITLGIIGVVAAMTMPALIQKNNNTITETRLKKFYSIFNQAILMSVKDNGDYMNWDYWVAQKFDNDGNNINNSDAIRNSFEKYIAPYMKITGIKEINDSLGKNYLYFLPDGGAFRVGQDENSYLYFYPANAEKCIKRAKNGENTGGICAFAFSFYPTSKVGGYKLHYRKGLEPHIYDWNGQYEGLYSHPSRGCSESSNSNRAFCTAVIQHNGWKIPKEYPFKISY